jgi:hypothetical protein
MVSADAAALEFVPWCTWNNMKKQHEENWARFEHGMGRGRLYLHVQRQC